MTKNKVRTAITMIGVWWGILLLIALLGAARGMENSFNRIFLIKKKRFLYGTRERVALPSRPILEAKTEETKHFSSTLSPFHPTNS